VSARRTADPRPGDGRVVIFYKSIPQYRRRFYELLRERLATDGIGLELIYGQPAMEDTAKGDSVDLPWAIQAGSRSVRLAGRELIWQNGLTRLRPGDLVIVEQASKLLLNYVLFALHCCGFIRLAYWGHGRSTRSTPLTALGERAKAFMSRRMWWWFAYNERGARFVRSLGYPGQRITSVDNSIDTRALIAAASSVVPSALVELRSRLGLRGDNVCVFVGGMYEDKRLPFLLSACELIRNRLPDFELVLVGDGPEGGLVREAAARHRWLHHVGPLFDDEKVPYVLLAKLMLMPGAVGLAVLDAFCLEVPLVTTDIPYHGPEIEYLVDGVNGVIVERDSDTDRYAAVVADLLVDDDARARLREGCRGSRERYSVERMAQRFADGVVCAMRD
jgi:glycosyltransferase involved in cell wall biosynthesis